MASDFAIRFLIYIVWWAVSLWTFLGVSLVTSFVTSSVSSSLLFRYLSKGMPTTMYKVQSNAQIQIQIVHLISFHRPLYSIIVLLCGAISWIKYALATEVVSCLPKSLNQFWIYEHLKVLNDFKLILNDQVDWLLGLDYNQWYGKKVKKYITWNSCCHLG